MKFLQPPYIPELHTSLQRTVQWRRDLLRANSGDLDYYVCGEEIVLAHGKSYAAVNHASAAMMGLPRMCFNNALRVALEYGLKYVEGYSMNLRVVNHAWCTDEAGHLFEVTWGENIGVGTAYMGVELDASLVEQITLAKGDPCLLDDWENGWPAQTMPWDPEALRVWYVNHYEGINL